MTKFVTSMILGAALLLGAAAGAYAADPQPNPQAYSATGFGPKASGGANAQSTHFQKPPGYDENPANFPYTRKGVLKAN